jgi:uncharacterized membrane protein
VLFRSAFFVASPAIAHFVVLPSVDAYSELGMLGPQRMADNYPSEIQANQTNNVFLQVTNHLGHAAYYTVAVKLVTQAELSNPASVASLNNITFFVANNETFEQPIAFALNYNSSPNQTQPQVTHLTINNVVCYPTNYFASRNNQTQRFQVYLVFELWLFSDQVGDFQNNGRFVDLLLTLAG